MIIITAKVRIREDAVDEFVDAYRSMRLQVMKDPGAILYSLHRSTEDPGEFLFYEQYEDEDAFAYHLSTDHFKTLAGKIDPLMVAPGDIGHWVAVE